MLTCPYCGEPAADVPAEVAHMEEKHPEVIEARLIEAGFRKEPDGSWTDTLATED